MKSAHVGIFFILMNLLALGCGNPAKNNAAKNPMFDSDGMLKISGRRTFVIGSYHLPKSDHPFRELAETGFNLVHASADSVQLTGAEKAGLMAWISLGRIDLANSEKSRSRIRKIVEAFRKSPALLYWETVDEPAWTWKKAVPRVSVESLIETYRFVKSLDPGHLLYMNHAPANLISTLQRYNPATDIVACDIYPVIPPGIREQYALNPDGRQGDLLNCEISQVGEYTRKMRRVAGPHRPVFMVLQGFAWEMLRKPADRDPKMILFPTRRQARFMAYDAIINGATGILYWGTAYTPQPSPFWNDLKVVVRELADFQTVLSAPSEHLTIQKEYREMGHSLDRGVEILAKKVESSTYLITANADKNPVKVTLKGLQAFRSVKVLRENREMSIRHGTFTETYKPFDVHIYRLKK